MKYTGIDTNGKQIAVYDVNDTEHLVIYEPILEYIEGAAPNSDHWWNGAGWVAIPTQPSENHSFNYVTKAWEDARSFEEVKEHQKMLINLARAKANQTSFTYEGKEIAVDALSRSDIEGTNGYVLANNSFPDGWPNGWKAMDNTYVSITDVATWKLFYAAMVNQGTANFAKAQALKAAIDAAVDAASTIATVEAIVW